MSINWWGVAVLSVRGTDEWSSAREISRGSLADMISLAMSWPEDEQERLFLIAGELGRCYSWPKIVELAARPDFPVFI